MVPRDRLLEWTVKDGWEPLCEFLGKPVPNEPFPHKNTGAGWEGQEADWIEHYMPEIRRNIAILTGLAICMGAAVFKLWT
jgi:hypothetical protein